MTRGTVGARACIQGEIELFDDYIRGNVYGYEIADVETEIDSCWGYYGDRGIQDIKDIFADFLEQEKQEKAREARRAAIEAAPLFVWGGIDPETLQAVNA